MDLWYIQVADRGGGVYDLVVYDSSDVERAIVQPAYAKSFIEIGPSFGFEILSAGLSDGIVWQSDILWFDHDVIVGANLILLGSTFLAHDPLDSPPDDPYITELEALEGEAQDLINTGGDITAAAKAFCADFLAWAADGPPR